MDLYRYLMCRISMVAASMDPLEIIQGANDKSLQNGGLSDMQFANSTRTDLFSLLGLGSIFKMLRRDLFMLAVCVIMVCLLKLMIMKRPVDNADKKMDIAHKFLIVFIGASIISILNILFQFFSTFI